MHAKNITLEEVRQRRIKKRQVLIAIAIFAVLFLSSIAYASGVGSLNMDGRAVRQTSLNLDLRDPRIAGAPRVNEIATIQPGTNNSEIFFQATVLIPNDSRTLAFRIANTGNVAARINGVTINNPLEGQGIIISTPENIIDYISLPNAVSNEFYVTVTWDPAFPNLTSGNYNFSITLDYAQN